MVDSLKAVHLFTERLGLIEWDVLVSESHEITEAYTQYPVESGAAINDHHYHQPNIITLTIAHGAAPFRNAETPNADISVRMGLLWEQLRAAQRSGELFEVGTAVELYENMAITTMSTLRDKNTSTLVNIQIGMQEIIQVDVSETDRFRERFSELGSIQARASSTVNQGNVTTQDISGTVEDKENESYLFGLIRRGTGG